MAKESARRGSAYAKAAGNLAWSGRALSLHLPEPDPGVRRLLAGVGNLLGSQSVQPGRKWNRFLPAGTRQPLSSGITSRSASLSSTRRSPVVAQKGSRLAHKITRYSEFRNIPSCRWRSGDLAHPCVSSSRTRNIKARRGRPRVHHRPYIGGPRNSLVRYVPVPVPVP